MASAPHAAGPAPEPAAADYRVRRSRVIPWLASRLQPGQVTAVTLGSTIYARPDADVDGALLRHERVHVRQWRRFGPIFPLLYLGAWLLPGNAFETAAERAEFAVVPTPPEPPR